MTKYRITKTFDNCEAAHQVRGLPSGHQCGRLHGHSYVVSLTLASDTVDEIGFVRDFGDLKEFNSYLKQVMDHQYLNQTLPGINPTAENIAKHLYEVANGMWAEVVSCTVQETLKGVATYTGGDD